MTGLNSRPALSFSWRDRECSFEAGDSYAFAEIAKLSLCECLYLRLEFSVAVHEALAEGGQDCTATASAADAGPGHRLIEAPIKVLEQQPCPAIAHLHFARGFR